MGLDFTGIHGAAASLLGALAGLAFAGAIQPVTLWFDRFREYTDQVATLSDWFRIFASRIGVSEVSAVASVGKPMLEKAERVNQGAPSAENRLAILLISYLMVRAKDRKGADYVDGMKKWPSVNALDYTRLLADLGKSDLMPRAPGSALRLEDVLDDTTLASLLSRIRAASTAVSLAAGLRRVTTTSLCVSVLFAAYGFLLLNNSLQHDTVLPDTKSLVGQVCFGAAVFLALGSYVAVVGFFDQFFAHFEGEKRVATHRDWIKLAVSDRLTSRRACTLLALSIDVPLCVLFLWTVGLLAYWF